ncbi:BatD family protein [Pseudohalioglobus lutimaris]|uniref:DUF7939 domain-containing protein n=1 Tax=Pseudohalioglobus lutimaris TaxID=1737061 RepID=A0A2N5WY45_9GAMM|nr:BatD family protein [Pseudohalioglobus lutimaris]PLW67163.1 hypothetical protein C0039_18320 [Pseudohalioglobus lutimaris]
MMKQTGNPLLIALLLLLLTASPALRAAVDASVDRHNVSLGDTLQLVISATEDEEDLSSVNFAELERDFQVLSRSTRSNTSIVNGRRSHNRQLQVEITPLRSGQLQIPAFTVGAARTKPLSVNVGDAPQFAPGEETVLFEATVDSDSVYVQGQVLLTLRLQQAINLDERSISELNLPDAFVVPLEQKSFQRRVNGRPWLVHEVRYAIFPEQSGVLTIPAQSFSARESTQRRSLFDSNRGRLLRLSSEPLQIEVLPQPASFTGSSWLPARNLVVEEEWSADTDQLRAGESVTRTIRLRGEGVQGAQLPPVLFTPIEGIKYYPDQPSIGDDEISSGLLGSRRDSVAIVPTRSGRIDIPAVEIPWWDTAAGAMRTAVIPARTLQVAPANTVPFQPPAIAEPTSVGSAATATEQTASALRWQMLALFFALGWIVTVVLWWLRGRKPVPGLPATGSTAEATTSSKAAYKSLLAACASDQATAARKAVIQWAAARSNDSSIVSLQQAAAAVNDQELTTELENLERILYGSEEHAWRGDHLRSIVEHLQSPRSRGKKTQEEAPQLYPT